MSSLRIRYVRNAIDLHRVTSNPCEPRTRFVVNVDVAPVVGPVRIGKVYVVGVAGIEPAEQLLRPIVATPARGRVTTHDRNAFELAHRRHAHDADLSRLTAAPKSVVGVQLARRNVSIEPTLLLNRSQGPNRYIQRDFAAQSRRGEGDLLNVRHEGAACPALGMGHIVSELHFLSGECALAHAGILLGPPPRGSNSMSLRT